jgi:hypothetical protein
MPETALKKKRLDFLDNQLLVMFKVLGELGGHWKT